MPHRRHDSYDSLVREYHHDIMALHKVLLAYRSCNEVISMNEAQERTKAYMANPAPKGSLTEKDFWDDMRQRALMPFSGRFAPQLDPKSLIDHIIGNTTNNVYGIMEDPKRTTKQKAKAFAVLEERQDVPAHHSLKILPPVLEAALKTAATLDDKIPPGEKENFGRFRGILRDMLTATRKANQTRNQIREKLGLGEAPPGISLDEINFHLPSFVNT